MHSLKVGKSSSVEKDPYELFMNGGEAKNPVLMGTMPEDLGDEGMVYGADTTAPHSCAKGNLNQCQK